VESDHLARFAPGCLTLARPAHGPHSHATIQVTICLGIRPGVSLPTLEFAPDPIFSWAQRRVRLGQLTCALSAVVGEGGRAGDIYIVHAFCLVVEDDAVQTLKGWRFAPGKPVPVHAPIEFLVSEFNTRSTVPWYGEGVYADGSARSAASGGLAQENFRRARPENKSWNRLGTE